MMRIFYGSPGAGKSYGALRDLLEELIYGVRLIVTNLSLDLGKLNVWIQTMNPEWQGDINLRIRLITEDETTNFYCYRKIAGEPLKCPDRQASLAGTHVSYPEDNSGVLYIIDEAHIKFDAREWKEAGPELTYYASQHRKLNDEVIFITQHPDMLNNRLRMLAQQFWSFNNHGMERVFTYFRKPSFFTCEVHRKMPVGMIVPPPESVHRYRLDKSLADCYDTSAGIGIKGRHLPEKKKSGGLSIGWVVIPAVIVVGVLVKIPDFAAWGVTKATSASSGLSSKVENAVISDTGLAKNRAPGEQPVKIDSTFVTDPVSVRYYAYRGGEAIVTLSDGRELTAANGLVLLNRSFAMDVWGNKYFIKRGSLPVRGKAGEDGREAAVPGR